MTHFYYYIAAGRVIDDTALFYHVKVHSTLQGDRDLLYLIGYAVSHGHYFEKRSDVSTEFFLNCKDSVNFPISRVQLVDARDLVRAFKKSEQVPLSSAALSTGHHLLDLLNTAYHSSKFIKSSALAASRKKT